MRARYQIKGTRSTDGVANHRLNRAYRNPRSLWPKQIMKDVQFYRVIYLGPDRMSTYPIHVVWFYVSLTQRNTNSS